MIVSDALSQPIALYVHVPFCVKICPYCSFYKTRKIDRYVKDYLSAIELECMRYQSLSDAFQIHSIFLGGGTPNALSPEALDQLLTIIGERFGMGEHTLERTSELNPEYVTQEHIHVFQKHGFNRFSLGVQSFQEKILKFLGRNHQPETVIKAVNLLQSNGLKNLNLDLIFSTPISKKEDIQKDVEATLGLNPTHISTYALTIEEGTPFYKRGIKALSDNVELAHYEYIQSELKHAGFEHYEVSAFAKPGFFSIHNLSYWQLTPYIGLGPSASSYLHRHFQNESDLTTYCESPGQALQEALSLGPAPMKEEKEDFLLTHLRLINGIKKSRYAQRFGTDIVNDYKPQWIELIKNGYIEETNTHIKVTKSGLALLDTVLVELMDSV